MGSWVDITTVGRGRSDEIFKLCDGTWRQVSKSQLGEFNHLRRFGYRLW